MATDFYIDGFNLYYGCLRGTAYRWLDLLALCRNLFPQAIVGHVNYFSARVTRQPNDPDAPNRQSVYWRALSTLPQVSIHKGFFHSMEALLPQYPFAYPRPGQPPQAVQIWKTSEKGSDVNLGVSLVRDGFQAVFDNAVVISNDSDLEMAVRIVVNECGRTVTVVNPHFRQQPSRRLVDAATHSYKRINLGALQRSQFPSQMTDAAGTFHKPPSW